MTETHHQFEILGAVAEVVVAGGQHFAAISVTRAGEIPLTISIPIEKGKYLLGGDSVTLTVSWSHNEEQTRTVALASGALDPATELDSDGNAPEPA